MSDDPAGVAPPLDPLVGKVLAGTYEVLRRAERGGAVSGRQR